MSERTAPMRHRFIVESLQRARRALVPALVAVSIAIPVLSASVAADEETPPPTPLITADDDRPFGAAPSETPTTETNTGYLIVADSPRPFGAANTAPRLEEEAPAIDDSTGRTTDGTITDGRETDQDKTAASEGKR